MVVRNCERSCESGAVDMQRKRSVLEHAHAQTHRHTPQALLHVHHASNGTNALLFAKPLHQKVAGLRQHNNETVSH